MIQAKMILVIQKNIFELIKDIYINQLKFPYDLHTILYYMVLNNLEKDFIFPFIYFFYYKVVF